MVPVLDVNEWFRNPLNSYILDFYMHRQPIALERWNGIFKDDVWDYLRNFELTLKALSAAIELRQKFYQELGQTYIDERILKLILDLNASFAKHLWNIAL